MIMYIATSYNYVSSYFSLPEVQDLSICISREAVMLGISLQLPLLQNSINTQNKYVNAITYNIVANLVQSLMIIICMYTYNL